MWLEKQLPKEAAKKKKKKINKFLNFAREN